MIIFVKDVLRLSMKTKVNYLYAIAITSLSVIFDQFSKSIILNNLYNLPLKNFIFNGLNIVYVENKGVSFGMLSEYDIPFFLGIISLLVSIYILFLIIKSDSRLEIVSLSMILGGALGNGFDRLVNGYVVDFIDFYYKNFHWPAFNFADTFITIGAILFFFNVFRFESRN